MNEINIKDIIINLIDTFLYAGKVLKIPSISEIMNLVRKAPDKNINSKSSQKNHIYFYGN